MEQNNQKRRSYSNEQNTSRNQDYDQRNRGYRNYDDDDYETRDRDLQNSSGQYGEYNDYDSRRNYERFNRSGDIANSDRNTGYGRGGRWESDDERYKDYTRGSYNRNQNYDRNYNQENYWNDFNRGIGGGSYGSSYNPYGNDYNRSQDYGRFNRSQDYGRNRNYEDYDSRRNYENDRGWWDRTKDEVSSWFGDDDAQRRRERDQRSSHRGKGPKDYKRSQERIREDINDRLSDAWDVDASEIEVKVEGSEVTLSGRVNSKNEKRRAEDIAEQVSGVSNVQNNLRVGQQQENQWSSTTEGSRTGTGFEQGKKA